MKIRVVTGGIIALHGLLRIIFIEKYIDFVFINFFDIIPAENLLTIGSAVIPFVEFFVGLLILTKINLRKSIVFSLGISVFMMLFIVAGSLYERLVYHFVVIVLMLVVYFKEFNKTSTGINRRRII